MEDQPVDQPAKSKEKKEKTIDDLWSDDEGTPSHAIDVTQDKKPDTVAASSSRKDLSKDYADIRKMIRVHPLAQVTPYKRIKNMWSNPWDDAPFVQDCQIASADRKWAPGSVSCVVRKQGDPNSLFIFTVGHACYDIDPWRKITFADVRDNQVPDFSWGEWKEADGIAVVNSIEPFATSHGKYERGGDKLGSTADCALMKISNDVLWSNQYPLCFKVSSQSVSARKVKLVSLDDTWAVGAGPFRPLKFMVRELEILGSEFEFHDVFRCSLVNWQGTTDSTLHRVLIRRRPLGKEGNFAHKVDVNGTSLRGGASGSALLRPGAAEGEAIVVGILIGRFSKWTEGKTKDEHWTEADPVYDVFQHVSVAQGIYGLDHILPQPVDGIGAPFYLESREW